MKIKTFFELDAIEERFLGVHDPDVNWNGFDCPSFELPVACAILRAVEKEHNGMQEACGREGRCKFEFRRDEEGDNHVLAFYNDDHDEWETWEKGPDGLYAVGSHAWCWGSDLGWAVNELVPKEMGPSCTTFDVCLGTVRQEAGIETVQDDTHGSFFCDVEWNQMDMRERFLHVYKYVEYLQQKVNALGNHTYQYYLARAFSGPQCNINASKFFAELGEQEGYEADEIMLCRKQDLKGDDPTAYVVMDSWQEHVGEGNREVFGSWFDELMFKQGVVVID